jgi:DNA-directed RNA polymerase II subunit RPB2
MKMKENQFDSSPEEHKKSTTFCWDVINSFINQYGLVRHQIESYDDFILNVIPSIIDELIPIKIHIPVNNTHAEESFHTFKLSNPIITPPTFIESDGTNVP